MPCGESEDWRPGVGRVGRRVGGWVWISFRRGGAVGMYGVCDGESGGGGEWRLGRA